MVDRANSVFQRMIDNGVKPDNDTYNCLIHGYLSIGRWNEVVRMLEGGKEWDIYTHSIILNGLCKNNYVDEAFKLF
jgi:leucine-rich PPR motif-containing protein